MIADWRDLFDQVKEKEYSKTLHSFLQSEYQNYTIYPPRDMVYQAFKLTKPKDLKVVIIGQDPYHNPGQAMGLSFSVPRGIDPPPSLINVYKEIQSDLKINMNFSNGDLTPCPNCRFFWFAGEHSFLFGLHLLWLPFKPIE